MSTNSRTCPECGAAVEGRPNKMFCDGACKGRFFRRTTSVEHEDESPESAELLPIPASRNYCVANGVARPDVVLNEVDERVLADQQQASALHAQFVALVRQVLDSAGRNSTGQRLRSLANDANRLSEAYERHPHRKGPHKEQLKERLQALYDLHDFLKENAEGVLGSQKTFFELKKKGVRQLRELLSED